MLFLWSTSLNNCCQQLEDQSGEVSIQHMMLGLCIAEMVWLCLDPSIQKLTGFLFACFVFVLTHLFVYCFWWSIIQAHLQGTAHARCWKKWKEERESRICYSTVVSQAPWQPGWLTQEWAGYCRGYFCGLKPPAGWSGWAGILLSSAASAKLLLFVTVDAPNADLLLMGMESSFCHYQFPQMLCHPLHQS